MNGDAVLPVLMIVLVVGIMIAAVAYNVIAARKRREAFVALAGRLGMVFSPERNHALADRFGFLNKLAQGSNRYAFNLLSGEFAGHPAMVFDYHYETHSRNSKGRRQTHHHYFSVFLIRLEVSFPELILSQESLFSKIAQAFGYDDIDFESAEFSRKFCVRSPDKKFAYDVCNPQMIEYLLKNPYLNIEIEGQTLALLGGRQVSVPEVEPQLQRLVVIRSLIPDYLFK